MVLAGKDQEGSGRGNVWKDLERKDGGMVSFQAEGTSCRKAWRHHCAQHVPEKPGTQLGGLELMIGSVLINNT